MVGTTEEVEKDDIDGAWAECSKFQVVRHYTLIIWRVSAAQGDSLRRFAEQLFLLFWPREEETAHTSVLQAVDACAGMHVQQSLYGSHQESPKQCFSWVLDVALHAEAHQLCVHSSRFRAEVCIIFRVHVHCLSYLRLPLPRMQLFQNWSRLVPLG